MKTTKFNLERFKKAQKEDFERAYKEVEQGRKQSHWMWYIFPQIKGLGSSYMSEFYGIESIEEAKDYMEDNYLSKNMLDICNVLLNLKSNDALKIMGYPDNLKLKSSMTLFYKTTKLEIFKNVLDKFFNGEFDVKTLELLKSYEK
ncbi:MAG: DUF1810 domain-containing protein [Bacilli bacterium]|nr:DUF1810 domain-containing protein [Bacilli bacterium]